MDHEFAQLFRKLRIKSGKTKYQLWKFSGVDQSYISNLESGNKTAPSRSIVILLGMALLFDSHAIEMADIEELLLAADHAPLRKRDLVKL